MIPTRIGSEDTRAAVDAADEEERIEGPFDGPRMLVHVGDETSWRVTPARATAEIEARARLASHPLAHVPVVRRDDALVFPRLSALHELDDAIATFVAGSTPTSFDATARAFLRELGGPIDTIRALGRAGLARSRVDRFLDRPCSFTTLRGPDLGGVMPAALRQTNAETTSISVRYGRAVGWPVIDLASLALRAALDTTEAHAEAGGDAIALDLAMLHQALRELTAAHDEIERERLREIARALVDRISPIEARQHVHLSVTAPPFVDRSLFAPEGHVEVAHALRVLRDWDGLHVGGAVVRVTTEPRLARPPRLFAFEPRRIRRARLFTRWGRIAHDEEGLLSATPEAIADRIAAPLSGVVVDATCGIGSIALALARSPRVTRVIAIDRDARGLSMAAHNAGVYGVADRIEFREGDALALVPALRDVDAVVIDPPWGGRDYDRRSITLDGLPMAIGPLLDLSCAIVLKLPRSFDVATLPPGFVIEAALDERGVLKMLIARRTVRSDAR
jgi:trimethylguanosine synthase